MSDELRNRYVARIDLLQALATTLESETKLLLSNLPHIDRVVFRVKRLESFVEKALDPTPPTYGDPLIEIEDQVAGRIIVFFLQDLEVVRDRLSGICSAPQLDETLCEA
jgi:putative GTP pyrophosphokinase